MTAFRSKGNWGYDTVRLISAAVILILSVMGHATGHAFESGDWAIHGFVSQGYMISEGNNVYAKSEDGSFQFNEAGVNFSAELSDFVDGGMQLYSRDLGDFGNNEVIVDWAHMGHKWKDWLGIRVGRIKLAHGFYNYAGEVDILRTTIFLPSSVYHASLRNSLSIIDGVSLNGNLALDFAGSATYKFQYGKSEIDEDGALIAIFAQSFAKDVSHRGVADITITDVEINETFAFALEWRPPTDGLRLGVTGVLARGAMDMTGPDGRSSSFDINENKMSVWSAEYTWEDVTLSAEYLRIDTDVSGNFPIRFGGTVMFAEVPVTQSRNGYYFGAVCRVTDRFETGAYYAVFETDKKNESAKPYESRLKQFSVGLRYDLGDHWILKAEGQLFDGTALMLSADNPDGLERHSSLLALKATFNF